MAKLDFIYDDILAEEDFLTEAAFKEYVGKVKAGLQKAAKDAGPNLKKGAKRAAIGAAMLGAAAGGITGYGAVHGIKQAKAEKAAQERQAEDIKRANEEKANAAAQKFHKAGVDFKDSAEDAFDAAGAAAKKYGPKATDAVTKKAKETTKEFAKGFKETYKNAKEGAAKAKEFLQKKANSAMQEAKNKKALHDEKKIAAEMKNYVASLAEEMEGASHTIYNAYRDDSSSWDLIPFCQKEYLKGLILREGEENVKKAIGLLKTQDFGERKITSQYVWSHQYKEAVEELKNSGLLKEDVNYFPY